MRKNGGGGQQFNFSRESEGGSRGLGGMELKDSLRERVPEAGGVGPCDQVEVLQVALMCPPLLELRSRENDGKSAPR